MNITIFCEYKTLHNWLAMASWYSVHMNIPDAFVEIECLKTNNKVVLFGWARKLKIPFRYASVRRDLKLKEGELISITPDIMAVNEFMEDSLGPSDVKGSDRTTFVKISDGVGRFKLSSWIDSSRAPFVSATSRLWNEDVSVNELKVLKLWERVGRYYSNL